MAQLLRDPVVRGKSFLNPVEKAHIEAGTSIITGPPGLLAKIAWCGLLTRFHPWPQYRFVSGSLLLQLLNGPADACFMYFKPQLSMCWFVLAPSSNERASGDRSRGSQNPTAGLLSRTCSYLPKDHWRLSYSDTHQVWSGHNQLLSFIIHLPLANANRWSLDGNGRNLCVLLILSSDIQLS